jgi:hypothetical protein
MAMSSLAYIYSGLFCEIFLSADLYRLCKLEDLNVIFYQIMPNLYNQYKSVERKNSQKNPE